jgi:DivIVA domain-containing protein
MNSDDDQETLGEIRWELADSRAKQADLAAGRADVIAAGNMAEPKAPPSAMEIGAPFRKADGLNAKQVEWVTFSKAPIVGKRGYDGMNVDAFLDLVEEQLRARQKSAKRAMPRQIRIGRTFPPHARRGPDMLLRVRERCRKRGAESAEYTGPRTRNAGHRSECA